MDKMVDWLCPIGPDLAQYIPDNGAVSTIIHSEFPLRTQSYAKKSPDSLCFIKDTINKLSEASDEIEIENFIKVASSNNAKEGVSAFLEKRKPVFEKTI